jgi:hypothetical protein
MTAIAKNIAIVVLGSILCLGVVFWVVRPVMNTASNLNHDLVAKRNEVAALEQQIRAYQTAKSDLSHATDKAKISNAILTKENLVAAIKNVELDSSRAGLHEDMTITDPFQKVAKPTTDANKTPPTIKGLAAVKEVPYRLSITSDYLSLVDFVSYLEHLSNFTEVTKFQLSSETVGVGVVGAKPVHTGRVISNIDGVFFVQDNAAPKN